MPRTLKQTRINCQSARAIMERARAGHFALGAFNIDNQETLIAVARAAAKLRAPVMVEVSQNEVDMIGHHNLRDMVDNYKQDYGITMFINLDHAPSVAAAQAGIDAGFEFIHIDVSQADRNASDQQIVAETKKVVKAAQKTGALVESEPHYFGGSSNLHADAFDYDEIRKTFSTPEGTRQFVEATGIDTFAAAVGNLHGKYPVPKQLDLELLQSIRDAIDVNISLHGGSGTPSHYFESAVDIGVTKININSDLRVTYRRALEAELAAHPNEYAVIKFMPAVINSLQSVVEGYLRSFKAENKA